MLSDNFDDNSQDGSKWTLGVLSTVPPADPAVTVLEQNLRLEIQPLSNVNGNHYDGYVSVGSFNLTNTRTSVEAVQAPTGGSDTIFTIGIDSNNYYRFVVSGALLFFQEKSNGVLTQTSIAFDPSNHHFWRFRHDPVTDTIVFETSPNGVTNWNDRRTVVRHVVLTTARIELGGGTSHTVAGPAKSIFDNFVSQCN